MTVKRKLAGALAKIMLLTASLCVAVLMVEVWARVTGRVQSASPQNNSPELVRLNYEPDPTIGWRGKPNASYTVVDGGVTMEVSNNSSGFRDREFSKEKPPGVTRIAVLGDSFVWGYGTDKAENRFTEQLQKALLKDNLNAEVYNFGFSGYSNQQEYLVYRDIASEYDPDLVILVYYVNDALDNFRNYGKPNFGVLPAGEEKQSAREDGEGKQESPSISGYLKGVLGNNLYTYRVIIDKLKLWDFFYLKMVRFGLINDLMQGRSEQELMEHTRDILVKTRDAVRADGAHFMVLWTPYIDELEGIRTDILMRRLLSIKDSLAAGPDLRGLDLKPLFLRAMKEEKKKYYQRFAGLHWNADGNRLVAKWVTQYLRREGLPPLWQ